MLHLVGNSLPELPPAQAGIELYQDTAHAEQRQFHRLCRTNREVHFVAGRQAGKTEAGAAEMVVRTVLRPKPGRSDYLIASENYDRVLAARFRFEDMLPRGCWKYRALEKRYIVRGPGGSTANVWIRNSDEDAPRSLTLDGAWIDEAAFAPEAFFDNLRPALAARTGDLWTTSTPKGQNHHFRMYTPLTDGVAAVFCESRANPLFGADEWLAAIRRYGYDSPLFQQEYRAIAAAFVGQAIPQFASRDIIQPVDWSEEWPSYVGLDPGWTAGTAAILAQIDPDENVNIWGLRYFTETPRHVVLASLNWPHVAANVPEYCIDPSGSSGRAPETGDVGWQTAMEDRAWSVTWNRLVGESAGLNMIREHAAMGKIRIAEDAFAEVQGGVNLNGADEIHRILAGAQLSKNIERDELDDSHPFADVLDALRYIYACKLDHLQRERPTTSRFRP